MKKFLLFALILLFSIHIFSQEGESQPWNNVVPPAPSTAALAKYADIPVNHYTGVPNISVPVYELKGHNISIPISLSYHASGIKVKEIASWVGLGWSLNAGGMISRTMRGKPDEDYNGYFSKSDLLPDPNFELSELWSWYPRSVSATEMQMATNLINGVYDLEPDMFSVNFMGYSGKFVIYNGKCHTVPYQNLKIELNGGTPDIDGFKVTTPDGIIYYFGKIDGQPNSAIETTLSTNQCSEVNTEYRSAWYLIKIDAFGQYVTFNYDLVTEKSDIHTTRTKTIVDESYGNLHPNTCTSSASVTPCNTWSETATAKLKNITIYNGESIEFERTDNIRDDMRESKGSILNKISIKNQNNDVIKLVNLEHGYYGGNSYLEKRLKLLSVSKESPDGLLKEKQSFEYIDGDLPSRDSYNEDHWGYPNAKGNTTNLPYFYDVYKNIEYEGADKSSNSNVQKGGILKKMTYATGGYTEFEYEPHDYGRVNGEDIDDVTRTDATFEYDINCLSGTPYETTGKKDTIMFVSDTTQLLRVTAEFETDAPGEPIDAKIKFIGDSEILVDSTVNYVYAPKGTYYFIFEVAAHMRAELTVRCRMHIPGMPNLKTLKTSGLRISKINHSDGKSNTPDITKEYTYNYYEETDRSSGILISKPPKYYSNSQTFTRDATSNSSISCFFTNLNSTSIYELSYTGGSHVAYKQVTEKIKSDNNEGFTIFDYSYYRDYCGYTFPYAPTISNEWRRGKLLKKRIFDKDTVLKLEEINEYEYLTGTSDHNRTYIPGAKLGWRVFSVEEGFRSWWTETYAYNSVWNYLKKKTTKQYFEENIDPLISTTEYFYENPEHIQVTKIKSTSDSLDYQIQEFSYPDDYLYPVCKGELETCESDRDNQRRTCLEQMRECEMQHLETCKLAYLNALDDAGYNDLVDDYYDKIDLCNQVYELRYNAIMQDQQSGGILDTLALFLAESDLSQCKANAFYAKLYDARLIAEELDYIFDDCILSHICDDQYNTCYDPENYLCEEELEQCMTNHYNSADSVTRSHNKMIEKFVVSPVIESRSYISDHSELNKRLTDVSLSLYKNVTITQNLFKPYRILKFQNQVPVMSNLYEKAYTDNNDQFVFDQNHLEDIIFIDYYDNFGNIVEFHKPNDRHTTFIWGYNFNYPVAKILGVSYDSLSLEQKYTLRGFENLSNFNDIDDLNINVRTPGFLPEGSKISTFTYAPSIGQTSATDPNGKSSYYEYDSYGRLAVIKDHNHDVVKSIFYHTGSADLPSIANIEGEAEVISGVTKTYTIDPVKGAYKYNWSYPSDAILIRDDNSTSLELQFVCSGDVSVTVESKMWCGTLNKSFNVIASPPVLNILQPVNVLYDSIYTFRVTNTDNISSFIWSVTGGATIISEDFNALEVQFFAPGSVSVSANSDKWCTASDEQTLAFTPELNIYTLTGTDLIDMSTFSSEVFTADGTDGVEYEWVLEPGLGNCIESTISADGKILTLDRIQNPFCFYPNPLTVKVRAKAGSMYTEWLTKIITIQD